jgi:hypothetical protein
MFALSPFRGFLQISNLPILNSRTQMNLNFSNLDNVYVVSEDGSYFGLNTAWLVDTGHLSDEQQDALFDGSDGERFDLCEEIGIDLEDLFRETPFLSRHVIYESVCGPYDEEEPDYKYFIPVYTTRADVIDCWIVNRAGHAHPGYSAAGVPIHTWHLRACCESPRVSN